MSSIERNQQRRSPSFVLGALTVVCTLALAGRADALAVDCIFSGCPTGAFSIEVSRTSFDAQLAELAASAGLPSGFFTSAPGAGAAPSDGGVVSALAVNAVYNWTGALPDLRPLLKDEWNTDPRNDPRWRWIKPVGDVVPEPSAALVFAVGILVAGGLLRRATPRP